MLEKKGGKECPFCGKEVEDGIIECPHCKRIFRLQAESREVKKNHSSVLVKKPKINLSFFVFGFILIVLLLFYLIFLKGANSNRSNKEERSQRENKSAFTAKNKTGMKSDNYEFGNKNINLKDEQKLNENISGTATLSHTTKTNEIKVTETMPSPEGSSPEDIKTREKKRTEASASYNRGISF